MNRWEFEMHLGGSLGARHGGGAGTLPITGATIGGQISVTSFFFGEATRTVNQNQASVLGAQAAAIVPLDPVLLRAATRWRQRTAAIGARASRAIRRSLAVEVSVEYERVALELTDAAVAGIEETRSSVERSLTQALSTSSVASTVSAVTNMDAFQHGSQVTATGTLVAHAKDFQRFTPFIAIGGGVMLNRIDTPSATLTARYEFGNSGEVVGTDSVRLGYAIKDLEYTGIIGAGVKYRLSPRSGIRFDGRARLLPNDVVNRVDTESSVARRSTGAPFPLINSGSLQFSTTAPLTGAPITGAATFASEGLRAQVAMSVGFFWRF